MLFLSAGMTSAPIRTNRAAPWVSMLMQRLIWARLVCVVVSVCPQTNFV